MTVVIIISATKKKKLLSNGTLLRLKFATRLLPIPVGPEEDRIKWIRNEQGDMMQASFCSGVSKLSASLHVIRYIAHRVTSVHKLDFYTIFVVYFIFEYPARKQHVHCYFLVWVHVFFFFFPFFGECRKTADVGTHYTMSI